MISIKKKEKRWMKIVLGIHINRVIKIKLSESYFLTCESHLNVS